MTPTTQIPSPADWAAKLVGVRVALLLGPDMQYNPQGRRVVSGEVLGFAPRSEDYVDLELGAIVTWEYGRETAGLEVLPPEWSGGFRVKIRGALAPTVSALAGGDGEARSMFAAQEIPFIYCPDCRSRTSGTPYCTTCGLRHQVALGSRPGAGKGVACHGCDAPAPSGAFCGYCGTAATEPTLEALVGSRVRLQVTARRQRLGHVTGVLDAVGIERPAYGLSPQVVARLVDVDVAGEGAARGLSLVVSLNFHVDERDDIARRVTAGETLRATELKRPCDHCADWGHPENEETALGRFCPRCGQRTRAFAHPDAGRRAQVSRGHSIPRHTCGAALREFHDLHCAGCGEELQDFRSGDDRFLWVGR